MMRRLVLVLSLAVLVSGCAALSAVVPILTDVVAVVQDAETILNLIDQAAASYFAKHPNPDTQSTYGKTMAKTRLALDAALRTARGTAELDRQKEDAAFTDFRAAYTDLSTLVVQLGIWQTGAPMAGQPLPAPLAMQVHP